MFFPFRLMWQKREDAQNLYVKKAMGRNTFESIIKHLYFVELEDVNPLDSFWKVRPLFDTINRTAKKLVVQSEYVSVDETMVRYFGPHPLKQCIRDKPERFGYKIWVLATPSGEVLACQPYGGANTMISDQGLGQGPNVVLGLAQQRGLKEGTKVACDNLFTSFDLLDHMGEHGWGVVGK